MSGDDEYWAALERIPALSARPDEDAPDEWYREMQESMERSRQETNRG